MIKQDLGFIVMESHQELGKKVYHKLKSQGLPVTLITHVCSRFSNGEGKVRLAESVREKDLYILTDIGNYSKNYKMHGFIHHLSPDEHYQDLKRVLSIVSGKTRKITIIMPLLYQARQHKRRDLTRAVNGKNPILEHVYLGSDVKDKVCLITDDMIATFALFIEGLEMFKEAKEKGWFDALYTTDLSYLPEELKTYNWTRVVDSSNDVTKLVKLLYTQDFLQNMK